VWLRALDARALTKIQLPVADRADILMRGLAHTGIIALVDEVTAYQRELKHKLFRRLTTNLGYPKLSEQGQSSRS
jgi:hypothetical protein